MVQQAFSVVEQLRGHCAAQLAELEQSVGSHQQLLEALRRSCPLQVSAECCTSTASKSVCVCAALLVAKIGLSACGWYSQSHF